MSENIFPRFISNQLPEGTGLNKKIFLAIAIGQITIGSIRWFYDKNFEFALVYLVSGFLLFAAYLYDKNYGRAYGLLFTKEQIKHEISRQKKIVIDRKSIESIQIRLLEIDFIIRDGSMHRIELGNFTFKTVREIKELTEKYAKINNIPFTHV
ncbi:MAG: hypothetical protein CVV24_06230 [Ignavibacteriae bacterium HGW-Ignavibacteriae-3]|nr:MAG: hypothetical protein CVV24_06230 [Ignavibacteriae bacterium HGW-Ignavibacteriae-3]